MPIDKKDNKKDKKRAELKSKQEKSKMVLILYNMRNHLIIEYEKTISFYFINKLKFMV